MPLSCRKQNKPPVCIQTSFLSEFLKSHDRSYPWPGLRFSGWAYNDLSQVKISRFQCNYSFSKRFHNITWKWNKYFSLKEINYCPVNLCCNWNIITCSLKIAFFRFNRMMDIASHYHTRHTLCRYNQLRTHL